MSTGTFDVDERVGAWWQWFAMALFLLLPVDLLTTLLAIGRHGIGVESNPVVRALIEQGIVQLVAANLLVAVLAVVLFGEVIDAARAASGRYRTALAYSIHTWVGLAVTAGVFLVANNLSALV